jgi:hypothetical protein
MLKDLMLYLSVWFMVSLVVSLLAGMIIRWGISE